MRVLTRYIVREWLKVLGVTALGFPLIVIVIDLTENVDTYVDRGLSIGAVAFAYLYSVPETMTMVIPAAVLFATVFTINRMGRHTELIAAHASGIPFRRLVVPILVGSMLTAGFAIALVEVTPIAAARQAELLGEKARRTRNTRYNFVYRAEEGWVYTIRAIDAERSEVRDPILERRGTGAEYPTIAVQAANGQYREDAGGWVLTKGHLRYLRGDRDVVALRFDSLVPRAMRETPSALLAEPKEPEEMRYAELGRYIEALERSGADAGKLKVERALKLAIPATCLIIALFGAPLGVTSPRQGAAWGVAVSLATTVVFLMLIQLSKAVGAGGLMPATVAAWLPNGVFGLAGLVMFARAKT